LKILISITKIFFSSIIFIFFLELFTRIVFYIPTNSDVFKYGFKKSVIFEIVDLSELQITIVDKERKFKIPERKKKEKIWIFGGSTTAGYNCDGNQSSSWPDQISIINEKFNFINFAFNGANTDQQITLFWKNIIQIKPEIIFWANKFNTSNIIGKNDYRNKEFLNYEFSNVKKTKILTNIKRLDKTLKKYLLSYAFMDKIILRLNFIYNDKLITQSLKVNPTKKDIIFSLKNFELNTIEAIEASKKYGVKEFFLISLFSKKDISLEKKDFKIYLYDKTINMIEKKYFPYVKIIDTEPKINPNDSDEYFCDNIHKTLKGNTVQASLINNRLKLDSVFFNE